MYLHLGGPTIVPAKDVVGIFDLELVSQSARTRAFLRRSEQDGRIRAVGSDLPASAVLCHGGGRCEVYLSPIASRTLAGRFERGWEV